MARQAITLEQLEQFEVDEANNLYWNDTRVKLEQRVRLQSVERYLAGAAAGSAVVLAVIEALRFFGFGHG